jgi:hypothetical protein
METIEIKSSINVLVNKINNLKSIDLSKKNDEVLASYMFDVMHDIDNFLAEIHYSGGNQKNAFIELKNAVIYNVQNVENNPFYQFFSKDENSLKRLILYCANNRRN